jgi:hypothetical protein
MGNTMMNTERGSKMNKVNNCGTKHKSFSRHWQKRIKGGIFSANHGSPLFLFLLLIFTPFICTGDTAGDIKGRFYISDYFSHDSNHSDLNILTSRLKLYKREDDKPGFYFNFDGRIRETIANEDIHSDIPEYKFDEIWLGYKFPEQRLNLVFGRQYINEMYNTYIDGLNVKYSFRKGLGVGIFGGFAPDKYDTSFNTKFRSFGLYGFLENDKYTLDLGYENLSYKGKTDREYFSVKFNSAISDKARLNVISSANIDQLTNNINIENINANFLYDYSKDLRIDLFYDYYSAIRYFESSKRFFDRFDRDYYIDKNPQTRTGLSVNYKLSKDLSAYASAAYQKRKTDNKEALRLTGGIRKYDLFGFDASGRYTYIDNFTSRSSEFSVELSRNLFDKLDVSVYASHEREKLDIENGFTSGLLTYGTSLYWTINKHYYASVFIERYGEKDYHNTSLFTQIGYRF